jgi:hypothetical protein
MTCVVLVKCCVLFRTWRYILVHSDTVVGEQLVHYRRKTGDNLGLHG